MFCKKCNNHIDDGKVYCNDCLRGAIKDSIYGIVNGVGGLSLAFVTWFLMIFIIPGIKNGEDGGLGAVGAGVMVLLFAIIFFVGSLAEMVITVVKDVQSIIFCVQVKREEGASMTTAFVFIFIGIALVVGAMVFLIMSVVQFITI